MESNALQARRDLARQLLIAAVDAAGAKGKAAVAIRLGYSREMLSRVLSPNDPLEITEKLATRIIDRLHVIPECPATEQQQPRSECLRLSSLPAPTHNPLSMRIWRTCQTCAHKPALHSFQSEVTK